MPFNRYKFNKEEKSSVRKRVYNSTLLPTLDKKEDDIYIYSVYGDRLDTLAYEYYGDATLWPVIATVNNIGKGTLFIKAGLQIRIPASPETFIEALRLEMKNR